MNLINIKATDVIKNYKTICVLLEESERSGKSKKLQIEDWKRYFSFENKGQKFIITEIYNTPKEKLTGNNNKYIDEIRDILTDYIYKNRDSEGKVILSFSKIINVLGLVNETYTIGNYKKRELSDILKIKLQAIYYFYNNTRSEFKNIVERALNSLQKRSVIHYTKIIMIGERMVSPDDYKYIEYRKADSDEVKMILDAQRISLESLELEDLQSLFLAGNAKYKEFIRLVMLQLPKTWAYYFNAYELIVGDYAIKSEYNIVKTKRLELNKKSIDRMTVHLKVVNQSDNEKKLIDLLIDLLLHDLNLDTEIKALFKQKEEEKYKRISENNNKIKVARQVEENLKDDNIIITKLHNNRDSIDKYDLYNYSNSVKERKLIDDCMNTYDGAEEDNNSNFSEIFEAFDEMFK